jgi:endonuclease YncB( thermonuclease family)
LIKLAILAAILIASEALAGIELEGVITEVHDGDSITLVTVQHTYKIRLIDIDAPELGQSFGKESRTGLREVCLLKRATVDAVGEDRFGRTLGRVRCVTIDANAEQVRRGLAWVFVRYAPKNSPLYRLEAEARDLKRGLWLEAEPVPPWEWRRANAQKEY